MAGLAGKWMRVTKSATNFKVDSCRSTLRTQLVETTNSESGPNASGGLVAEEFVFGVYGGDVDITIVYQLSDGVYTALANGGTYTVTFLPDKATAGSSLVGSLSVETFDITSQIRGRVEAKVTGKFNGGFTATSL